MRFFKKWSSILLAALLCGAVLLTGCDSNKDPEQGSSEDVQQPTEDMPGDTTGSNEIPTEQPTEKPEDPVDKVDPVGLTYKVNDDGKTCAIRGIGSVTDADLVIPSKIDQYTVTSIADNAFKDCTNLTSVVISDGVTGIGEWAFSGCTSLTSITLPDGVTGIGEWAFSGCTSLTSITIPDSVTQIGIYAFQNCKSLTSITLSDNVTSIGDYAFRGCIGLTSILLGDNVTYIGWYAFDGCTDLTSITIPDGVTGIGWYAFFGCTDLTSITIPHSVTSIGNQAFSDCTGLKTVYYGGTAEQWVKIDIDYQDMTFSNATRYYYSENQPTTTGKYWRYVDGVPTVWVFEEKPIVETDASFFTFTKLSDGTYSVKAKDVTNMPADVFIPATYNGKAVTSIGSHAFSFCESIANITIPDSVTSIGAEAFRGCSNLKSIAIPHSVTSIAPTVFYRCTKLEKVYITDIEAWCRILFSDRDSNPLHYGANLYLNNKLVVELELPNTIKKINSYAFIGCISLVNITIPNSVTSIGESVFEFCSGITDIVIPDSVTGIGDFVFYGCENLSGIVIPDSVTTICVGVFDYCNKLKTVYYGGSEEEWKKITIGSYNSKLTKATHYYYSETEPTTSGNYWHYVDGVPTAW